MEMPASIAAYMPEAQRRARATETERLGEVVTNLLRRWAWLDPQDCAKYLACVAEQRARKHMGRKKKVKQEGAAV